MRLAGEGDLLARLEALRKQLRAEGLFELQKQLARPRAAEDDRRRHGGDRRGPARPARRAASGAAGAGTVVWAFAPVQDRHAAPAIAAAIQDLAARPEVEAIVVTRGGGSLADLWAFCDETLCRTVAMLRVPVVSAVGHERDTTLIDDVAAVACSTPTHAAEAAVPLDCGAARRVARALRRRAAAGAAEGAVGARAPPPGGAGPRPGAGAAARAQRAQPEDPRDPRRLRTRRSPSAARFQRRIALVVLDAPPARARGHAAAGAESAAAAAALERSARRRCASGARRSATRVALRAHDPERTLERGYALRRDRGRRAGDERRGGAAPPARVRLRFADGGVDADDRGGEGGDERGALRATRPRSSGWSRSSTGSTPARPACARPSTSAARGRELVTYCAAELDAVGEGLKELRLDELAARLEAAPAQAGDASG